MQRTSSQSSLIARTEELFNQYFAPPSPIPSPPKVNSASFTQLHWDHLDGGHGDFISFHSIFAHPPLNGQYPVSISSYRSHFYTSLYIYMYCVCDSDDSVTCYKYLWEFYHFFIWTIIKLTATYGIYFTLKVVLYLKKNHLWREPQIMKLEKFCGRIFIWNWIQGDWVDLTFVQLLPKSQRID